MKTGDNVKHSDQNNSVEKAPLNNLFRSLTMLEKALERLARQNYHGRNQYPEIFFEIENTLDAGRTWIQTHSIFSGFLTFHCIAHMFISELKDLISLLTESCRPVRGKKAVKKSRRLREQAELCRSIDSMTGHMTQHLPPYNHGTSISVGLEQALADSFSRHCLIPHKRVKPRTVSQRGEKTFVFPWSDPKTYPDIVNDRKRFRDEVVSRLENRAHAAGHRPGCPRHTEYKMRGFRPKPRRTVMPGGKQQEFPVRMVECAGCGQKFSLLPSFLPREKHFSIDLIGHVLRNIVLFGQSINGALENFKICGRSLNSRQTVYNWLRWTGTFHPATILTRAGAQSPGYFQEDEGFEKEVRMRTYTVVMVDPKTLAVWHMDYTDRVDEETLCSSFENFLRKINFNVLGITKDRWEASTNALKSVFYRVWIGFCHLHCLKKFGKALTEYQKKTDCSDKDAGRLRQKFRKVLKTACSAGSMRAKLKSLNDEAFEHPLLKARVDELRENAVRYTSHKKRNGITVSTSAVDNFLKIVKRKLRQVGSFRDREYAKILFQATANIRNFVPFLSGAKNAGKSPFMMAGGETYDLPWMQVMNMHNAFLFTDNAF